MAKRTKSQGLAASELPERTENSEVRKLRNRISQKAFRARQAMRMKVLEERVHIGARPNAEWVTRLQDQNAALREQLLECHKKFTSLQVSMKALADASAIALGIDSLDSGNESSAGRLCARCKRAQAEEDQDSTDAAPSLDSERGQSGGTSSDFGDRLVADLPSGNGDSNGGGTLHIHRQPAGQDQQAPRRSAVRPVGAIGMDVAQVSDDQSIPMINLDYFSTTESCGQLDDLDNNQMLPNEEKNWTEPLSLGLVFTEDLGPLNYKNIWKASLTACQTYGLKRTNSPFSDHIDALEYCLCWSWSRFSTSSMPNEQITSSIESMLLTFVNMSWQSMTAWHTYTKAHIPLKDLMAWRIYKTPDRYLRITPAYQPTKLQINVPHPSIIDWIPWPQLRDKLIIHHSANPCLDSLICDIGNSYVVSGDLSLLVECPQPVAGYIGVWDLVRAIAPEATMSSGHPPVDDSRQSRMAEYQGFPQNPAAIHNLIDNMYKDTFGDPSLPASDAKTLFSSRALAAQAFKILGLDKGAFNFRLDPAFFGRHPELYDSSSDLMAQGVALRPNNQVAISAPRELDTSVLGQYQEMSRYLTDAALEPCRGTQML